MEIKETMSITEMRDKIKETEAGKTVQEMLNSGYYDYDEYNMFGTGYKQREEGTARMGREDAAKIVNTLKVAPLKEFLAKSGTTGIMGAAYLIPVKLHQTLYDAAWATDITPDISMEVLGPEAISGATQDVAIIAKDHSTVHDAFLPLKYSSGGELPDVALTTKKATLDFSNSFGYRFELARDLIEDSQWDMLEAHLRNAAGGIGEYATNLCIAVLNVATDGDGTTNTNAAGANTTTLAQIMTNYRANVADRFIPNIFITSPEAWFDAICQDTTFTSYATDWHNTAIVDPIRTGLTLVNMKVLWNVTTGTQSTAATPLICSYLIQKESSLLTGRKRWMRIENYSEPRRDLAGATVTCRQDSVTIYNDSIAKAQET
jgi:hypothetical protein